MPPIFPSKHKFNPLLLGVYKIEDIFNKIIKIIQKMNFINNNLNLFPHCVLGTFLLIIAASICSSTSPLAPLNFNQSIPSQNSLPIFHSNLINNPQNNLPANKNKFIEIRERKNGENDFENEANQHAELLAQNFGGKKENYLRDLKEIQKNEGKEFGDSPFAKFADQMEDGKEGENDREEMEGGIGKEMPKQGTAPRRIRLFMKSKKKGRSLVKHLLTRRYKVKTSGGALKFHIWKKK